MQRRIVQCLTILFFLSGNNNAFGQGFSKNYVIANSYLSVCTDALETGNGHIMMIGYAYDTLVGANMLTIVGADSDGAFLWKKSYGKPQFEYLHNPFISRAGILYGNMVYVYSAAKDSVGKYFSVLMQVDPSGDTLWQKKFYDPTERLYVQGITRSVDNGFLLTGFFSTAGSEACALIKTDQLGNELWRKKIAKNVSPKIQWGYKVFQDSATKKIIMVGNEYLHDNSYDGSSPYAKAFVFDSLGNLLSSKIFGGLCGSGFYDLIQAKDKKCVAVGYYDQCNNLGGSAGARRYKSFIVKFDLNQPGLISWQRQIDTLSTTNYFSAICELSDGNYLLGGGQDTLEIHGTGSKSMLRLVKTTQNGDLIWKKYLSRDNVYENSKSTRSLNLMSDKGFLVAIDLAVSKFPRAFSIVKTDSLGCDSSIIYCDYLRSLDLTSESLASQLKVYPSPVRHTLKINAHYSERRFITVSILNLTKEVANFEIACNQEVSLDVSQYEPGMYILVLRDQGKIIATKKISILSN